MKSSPQKTNASRAPAAHSFLRFGPGGVPLSTRPVTNPDGKKYDIRSSGLFRLEEMGLDLMEIEFVYGVKIAEDAARSLGILAQQKNIQLTVHGPYYINLSSKEPSKYHSSIIRIQQTIQAAQWLQAKSLTFHAGFYQGRTSEKTTELIENALFECVTDEKFMRKTEGAPLPLISIETTGKPSQWGSLDEIIALSARLNEKMKRTLFSVCVDFSHIYARSNGEWNSDVEFAEIVSQIENALGNKALDHLHMHVSGINYSAKGEKKHLPIEEAGFNYRNLLKVLKEKHISGWLVCESPILEKDAALLKRIYEEI